MGKKVEPYADQVNSCLPLFAHHNKDAALKIFSAIASTQSGCMLVVNADNRIVWSNKEAKNLLALDEEEIIGRDITTIFHKIENEIDPNNKCPTQLQSRKQDLLEGNNANLITIKRALTTVSTDYNKIIPIELTVKKFINIAEHYRIFLMLDRREMEYVKQNEEMLHQRFKLVSDAAPIGILQANENWEAIYVNDRWCQTTGLSIEEVMELGWINSFTVKNLTKLLSLMESNLKQGKEVFHETYLRTPLGVNYRVELRVSPIIFSDGSLHGFIALLSDISVRFIAEQKLRELAEHDALTGLSNRAKFQEVLKNMLHKKDISGSLLSNLALFCIDLDGFKTVNDSFGHDAGDTLLKIAAHRLNEVAVHSSLIARVGGDEFMLIIQDKRSDQMLIRERVHALAVSLLKRLSEKFVIQHQSIRVGASIGVAFCFKNEKIEPDTLIKHADTALYHAKSTGRNNVQIYSGALKEIDKKRNYLLSGLPQAIMEGQFQVLYQLQSDVSKGGSVGAEALLRWQHPTLGLLGPDEFIPLLESSGNIAKVSRLMWHRVFKDFERWKENRVIQDDYRISINASPSELLQPMFAQNLLSVLAEYAVPTQNVTMEITETSLMENVEVMRAVLVELRKAGVCIALDDFGTGYSSMTNLRQFPIDYIKIDHSFVRGMNLSLEDEAITETIIRLSKFLNKKVVAEGVEKSSQLKKLKNWGCDYYQGFFINRPCSADELENIMEHKCE